MKNYRKNLLLLRSKLAFSNTTGHSWQFSDVELERLLKAQPRTLDELGAIKGFPRDGKRVKAYGKLIIDIFNNSEYIDFDVKQNGTELNVKGIMQPLSSFTR